MGHTAHASQVRDMPEGIRAIAMAHPIAGYDQAVRASISPEWPRHYGSCAGSCAKPCSLSIFPTPVGYKSIGRLLHATARRAALQA
jgi:hypothetical protein